MRTPSFYNIAIAVGEVLRSLYRGELISALLLLHPNQILKHLYFCTEIYIGNSELSSQADSVKKFFMP